MQMERQRISVPELRYLEEPVPIHFPESAEMPEGPLNFDLRTALYLLLREHLGPEVTVRSDQFMYFEAEDPTQCLAPDAFVRLIPRLERIPTWKVWLHGAPEVAVEIISPSDSSHAAWQTKLARYRRVGVRELVRFNPLDEQRPLRIWDRVQGSLIERVVSGPFVPSSVLELYWALAPVDDIPLALRIATAPSLDALLPTGAEARQAEAEARQAEAEARQAEAEARQAEAEARQIEAEARCRAEARVAELEAELRRLEAD
jgi:Uma2 family endonuclease